MKAFSVLVTGANRGIGLEFVRQLLALPSPPQLLFATCRNPQAATELNEIQSKNPSVHVLKLDVKDHGSFPSVVSYVKERVEDNGLTILLNNSGIMTDRDKQSLDLVSKEDLMESFEVNTVGPLLLTQSFLPLLRQASNKAKETDASCSRAAVVNITSKMGSVADASGHRYTYRLSKTALNMATYCMAKDLKEEGILALLFHPGWVQTDMGGPNAIHSLQDSVTGMLAIMQRADSTDSGKFYDFKGNEIPW